LSSIALLVVTVTEGGRLFRAVNSS
jgi:hypothetical protein